ncbi:MAG TPA: DivIVA domain-containing protein, partial [Candidatus Dormibacteraeota bacterium]|nr:DivIVA domain-containing protein [Candidatus Dormibacteraeota bacterium]
MADDRPVVGFGRDIRDPLSADLIAQRGFAVGFRGYDQVEVREFLGRAAEEVRALRTRIEQLDEARRDAEDRAAHPAPLDEDGLMAAVGEETGAILRVAKQAAAEVRRRAEAEAARIVEEARAEATETQARADSALATATREAQEEAARLLAGPREEGAALLTRAREEAEAVRRNAETERKLTIGGAQATREKILADLSRRRRVASVQIEQLRSGRERLLESYAVVRRTLEEVNDALQRADADARAAAEETGRRMERELAAEDDPADEGAEAPLPDPAVGADPEPGVAPVADADPEAREAARPGGGPRSGGGRAKALAVAGCGPHPQVLPQQAPAADELPAPHLRVVPDPAGAGVPAAAAAPGTKVDQLFARIRAGREDAVAEGRQVLASQSGPAEVQPADQGERTGGGAGRSDVDEMLLQRRDSAIVDLEASLTRKLKRAMQDDQNDLLDRLRSLRREPTAATLLATTDEQAGRFATAARPLVEQAAAAGADFSGELAGRAGGGESPAPPGVDDLATQAGMGIAEPL